MQETLNYWKQLPHILKYFRAEEDPNARRPQNFMSGFLEVSFERIFSFCYELTQAPGPQLSAYSCSVALYISHLTSVEFCSFPSQYAVQCCAITFGSVQRHHHAFILFPKSSLATTNFSATTSHKSIRSCRPFSSASSAVPSKKN